MTTVLRKLTLCCAAVFTFRIVTGMREIAESAWNSLLRPGDTPFLQYTWLRTLEDTECASPEAGWTPLHGLLYEGETLRAALPMYVKAHSQGEFVFDWAWADASHRMGEPYYPKLVVGVPFTPATGARVLGEHTPEMLQVIAQALREFVDENPVSGCHVLFPEKKVHDAFVAAGFLSRFGVQYQFDNAPYADFEDFLKVLPTKKRTQLRRERKEMSAQKVHIETVPGEALTSEHVEAMHRFYAATVDKFYYGSRYLNRAFFDAIGERFRAHLRWVFAHQDGKLIAGAFNVQSDTVLYGRYWGADRDIPFLHFNVCYYHGIEECLRQGLVRFEPGAGGEHKHVRGFLPHFTYSAHYVKSSKLHRALVPFLDRERRGIEQYVREGALTSRTASDPG
jgi:uncharacterized protein